MAKQSEIILGREIRVKDAKIPLRHRPRLLILIKQREHVRLELPPGHQRRPLPSATHPDHPGIKIFRLLDPHPDLRRLRLGRPPGLPDGDLHAISKPELLHRGVDGVHLRVEHAGVVELRPGVVHPGVGPEHGVVEVGRVVAEVRVGVDHERRPGVVVEPEHGREDLGVEPRAEPRVGRDPVGGGEDPQVVRRGDADVGEALELERLGETTHRGEEGDDEVRDHGGAQHLVPGQEERHVGARGDVWGEVVADPAPRRVQAAGSVGEGREDGVGDGDGQRDGRRVGGERVQEGWVGVEELHAVDGRALGEEGGDGGGGGQVVGVRAVVDSDGQRGQALLPLRRRRPMEEGGEEEEEEREHREACARGLPSCCSQCWWDGWTDPLWCGVVWCGVGGF